jgi:hypothetical protein
MDLVNTLIDRIRAPFDQPLQLETAEHLVGGLPGTCHLPSYVSG